MGGSGGSYLKNKKGLTSEDIANMLNRGGDSDSYIFDVEYEKLQKENERLREEYERAREEYMRISEELRREMANGTASAADEARFMAMLSDRGVQLQHEQSKMEDSMKQLTDQRADIDKQLAELRRNAFSGATRAEGYQEAKYENSYRGFKNDNWGEAKVVEMSPAEYMRRMAFQFGNGNLQGILRTLSPREIEKIARQMRRGIKFNSPSLNYALNKGSGSAQVIAALMNGYKRIPVLIVE